MTGHRLLGSQKIIGYQDCSRINEIVEDWVCASRSCYPGLRCISRVLCCCKLDREILYPFAHNNGFPRAYKPSLSICMSTTPQQGT